MYRTVNYVLLVDCIINIVWVWVFLVSSTVIIIINVILDCINGYIDEVK